MVPSRTHKGTFYSLPQSPQQYNSFLWSVVLKIFSICKMSGDEDARGDRQPEFTQLDMEMSFVTEEDVIQLNEKLLIETIKIAILKRNSTNSISRMSYRGNEKYGSDRPDIRKEENPNLWLFMDCDFPMFKNGKIILTIRANGLLHTIHFQNLVMNFLKILCKRKI